jgi:1-acyl-sn-glycerol-3-phosphate acyltransferase
LAGWRVVGDFPPALQKAVLVVAPHTSNWDFIVLILAKFTLGVHVSFIGKHTLFRGPFGWWLRNLGGIPVDRAQPGGVVETVVDQMRTAEQMYFALAPEGTRSLGAGWKTGFHRIAVKTGVPVVPVIIDAGRRELRIADPMTCTGDINTDFAHLAGIFATAAGIRARLASPIRPN